MALRKIIKMPNSFLRKKASVVDTIDNDIKHILDDMLETMYNANGIGLAATQIGIDKRLVVMDCGLKINDDDFKPNPIKMINPEIISFDKNLNFSIESSFNKAFLGNFSYKLVNYFFNFF